MALGLCVWPLVIPEVQSSRVQPTVKPGLSQDSHLGPEKVKRTSSVLRGPFDYRGPSVLEPFDSQRCPES